MPHRFSRSKDRIDHRGTNLNREIPTLQDLILVHNITYKKGAFAPFVYVITKLVLSGVSLSNATSYIIQLVATDNKSALQFSKLKLLSTN
jgi:hypothetical protein